MADGTPDPEVVLRPASEVMRLERMGAAHQTRLSFMRVLLRRLRREGWVFDRPMWEIDARGVGRALYRARGPRRTYTLVAFAHDLPDEMRSDRVIATAWDATFTLFDGEPLEEELERLAQNVPKQEAGRVSARELSMSRANRSVRLWDHVARRLSEGQQPDPAQVDAVGYLMRTTAVYGSGKFGAADRAAVWERPLMGGPFRLEMLSVWLIRAFTIDLVEHMAAVKGGANAVRLDPDLRRRFGIGNSTGLGMAPFLVNHPALLDAWIRARETAIARVRALAVAAPEAREVFQDCLTRARLNAGYWTTEHPGQKVKCAALVDDLAALSEQIEHGALAHPFPWEGMMAWAQTALSLEGQEQLAALMLEPYGDLVDDLAETMIADEAAAFRINGGQRVGEFRSEFQRCYSWAFDVDYTQPQHSARFWYVSAEKLEPRLGERYAEPGAEFEHPLGIGREAEALNRALAGWDDGALLADFLLAHPEHRHVVRRAQLAATLDFSEIQDNLLCANMQPIDILRCKLAFFGATRFDPRSDRWVRICMFQNAPFPDELDALPEDDWAYPPREVL